MGLSQGERYMKGFGIRERLTEAYKALTRSSDLSGVEQRIEALLRGEAKVDNSPFTLSAYFRGINCISNDMAMLPLKLYQTSPDGRGRALAVKEHPLNALRWAGVTEHSKPLPNATSFDVRKAAQGHALGSGNGLLHIVRERGIPKTLCLLPCGKVKPYERKTDGGIYYKNETNGVTYLSEDIIHIKGFSLDGISGLSVASQAKATLALAKNAETTGEKFFENAGFPSGVLQSSKALTDDEYNRLRTDFEAIMKGGRNAGKVAILEEGMTYNGVSVSFEDAQFLATRQFQVIEIARWLGVPPNKLMDYSESHYDNVESANSDYASTTLGPWCKAWEEELDEKLLTEEERADGYYWKLSMQALLRGNMQARASFYKELFSVGAFSPNDILRFEDMNGHENGDDYYVPSNLTKLGGSPVNENPAIQ
jgi:HK97 family phage portal protein